MKIYIAGSITNNPDYKEQFEKAEKELINKGYEVVNPTKNDEDSYKNYIDVGLKQLMDCDAIYMLSGYENSKGAMLEKHYAEVVGLKVGEKTIKVKPQMIQDDFMGDYYSGCPNCKEVIHFPLIRNPEHIYDYRPIQCSKCGAFFDWSDEKINHPKHYNIPGRKECIEEMLEIFGTEKVQAFCELNAYKYRYRHDLKNGQEDLDKAKWYEEKKSELEFTDRRFQIAHHYGLSKQENQLIEEMAELTQAICKMNRINGFGQPVSGKISDFVNNLIEELADVKLVLNQVISLTGYEQEIQEMINQKIERTLERIGEE